MPENKELSPGELERLYDCVAILTTTLEWPVARLANQLGYPSTEPINDLLIRSGSVGRATYEAVLNLVEHCAFPSQVEKRWDVRLSRIPPRRAQVEPRPGRRFRSLLDRLIVWRTDQGMPTSVYIKTARDLIDQVVSTFEEGIANASNAASAPVLQRLKNHAHEFRAQLEEALASK